MDMYKRMTVFALVMCFLDVVQAFGQDWPMRTYYSYEHFDSTANFDGAQFRSRASFWDAQFDSTANFYGAQFRSRAIFVEAQFRSRAIFVEAQFRSTANFSEVTFDSWASFNEANFNSTANFSEVTFDSWASFVGTHFVSTANFYKTHFDSTATFVGTHFDSTVNFSETHFESMAEFRMARFGSMMFFRNTQFGSTVIFWDTHFDSTADFSEAQFGSEAMFSSAIFKDGAIFDRALLPDILDFDNVKKIGTEIDFTYARKDFGVCHINLLRSDISKIKLQYDVFRLYFPDGTSIEEKSNVYEALLAKFKADGYNDSYETLDIEYRKLQYAEKGEWYWDALQEYWWNYGYSKERIFLWIGVFLLGFTLINWPMFDYLSTKVYSIDSLARQQVPSGCKRQFLRPFLALTYTCFIFFGVKIDPEGIKELSGFRRYFALFYIFTVYSIGLICLAYLANFIVTK